MTKIKTNMTPKHHVSQTIAKQLAEAGIVIESEYVWQKWNNAEDWVIRRPIQRGKRVPEIFQEIPAPIATELLERLPTSTCLVKKTDLETKEKVRYNAETFTHHPAICPDLHSENPCDALALLLIRLTKDGLI
jgi:hypothetical protein